jgi:hypothetical protein
MLGGYISLFSGVFALWSQYFITSYMMAWEVEVIEQTKNYNK